MLQRVLFMSVALWFLSLQVVAASDIQLSEVYACAGTGSSEWIELWNSTDADVTNQSGWKLRDNTSSNAHTFVLNIPAHGYQVVEVTSAIYNNSGGDQVKLYDPNGSPIDEMTYASCSSDKSWAKNASSWEHTSTITKGEQNSQASPTSSATPSPTPVSEKVFLSEIRPCSGAGEQDWIELRNTGSTDVNITDWILRNDKNHEHKFSVAIEKNGYVFIDVSKTLFREDRDTVTLITNTGNIVDTYAYVYAETSCEPTITFAKTSSWQLTTNATPGKANSIATPRPSSSPTPSVKPSATPTSSPTPSPSVSPSPTASASGEVLGISEEEASVSALQLRDISDEDQPEHAGSVVLRIPPQALYLAYLSIGIGITCLTCAGVLFYRDWYNRKKKRKRKK